MVRNAEGNVVIETYGASPTKRHRATQEEVWERRWAIHAIVQEMQPMTVRQVFYQATVRGLVDKTEEGYRQVQNDLTILRREGHMPYGWLADNTRWQRKPTTWGSIEEALEDTARLYRKSLWVDADAYVEIWLEKDALSGVLYPVTALYDVPLMVARGYASLSFLHSAAESINDLAVPAYLYHLGDFDPSGVNAGEKIEETLRELAPDAEIYFERIAVTLAQITAWNLPTRPTEKTDSRAKKFGEESVELDAIDPDRLRALVQNAIEQHLPADQFDVLKAAEESERQQITGLVGMLIDTNENENDKTDLDDDEGLILEVGNLDEEEILDETIYIDQRGTATVGSRPDQDDKRTAEVEEAATPQPPLIRRPRGISPLLQATAEPLPPVRRPRR